MLANDGFCCPTRQQQLNQALNLACKYGYVDLAEELCRDGAEILVNPDPLCIAADFDELRIAEYLVEHGADIDARSLQFGQTPLMDAAGSASLGVFNYLLQRGADTTAMCNDGMTALDWAKMGRHTAALPETPTVDGVLQDYDTIIEMLTQKAMAK
jgi:ankyrin repeat protein